MFFGLTGIQSAYSLTKTARMALDRRSLSAMAIADIGLIGDQGYFLQNGIWSQAVKGDRMSF